MKRIFPIFILLLIVLVYGNVSSKIWISRKQLHDNILPGYVIPSKFSRILALGHQGLLSDFIFLKTITFLGGKNTQGLTLVKDDWDYVFRSLDVVTDLDPYFVDPYFLTEGLLAWDAGKPAEANTLLEKGMKYRTTDWRLPYFVGFNNFYFLKDYKRASEFMMKTAALPGSPDYVKTLAARLAYYGGRSKTALLFLKEMLAEAKDPLLKKRLQMRLAALEGAATLEESIEKFKHDHGFSPRSLNDLVSQGYLVALPVDPYGGQWVILKNGRVFSTSKFTKNNGQK